MYVSYTDHAYGKVNGNGIKNRMSRLNKVYRKWNSASDTEQLSEGPSAHFAVSEGIYHTLPKSFIKIASLN